MYLCYEKLYGYPQATVVLSATAAELKPDILETQPDGRAARGPGVRCHSDRVTTPPWWRAGATIMIIA